MANKIRVLVVDDNLNFLQLAQMALGADDYEVHTATDGRDGFDQARLVKPDVILMDADAPRFRPGAYAHAASTRAEADPHPGHDGQPLRPFHEQIFKQVQRQRLLQKPCLVDTCAPR